jgi:hypothetical protein
VKEEMDEDRLDPGVQWLNSGELPREVAGGGSR